MVPPTPGSVSDDVTQVVVLAGGDPILPPLPRPLPTPDVVIAADSGLAAADALHLDVDRLVGDLDSVAPADLDRARDAGVEVDRHPVDKDRTDLAIALDAATELAPAAVTVVGGHGGRLDHLLGGTSLLAAPAYAELSIVALMGDAVLTVVRGTVPLSGRIGELVSLVPIHGPAHGIVTEGLRFPLDGEELPAGSSRGVSNVLAAPTAAVTVTDGVLLAVQPGELAPDADPGAGTR